MLGGVVTIAAGVLGRVLDEVGSGEGAGESGRSSSELRNILVAQIFEVCVFEALGGRVAVVSVIHKHT